MQIKLIITRNQKGVSVFFVTLCIGVQMYACAFVLFYDALCILPRQEIKNSLTKTVACCLWLARNLANYCCLYDALTPGPIVAAVVILRKYCPLAAAGFAFTMASIKALKLSCSFSTPKLFLPIGQ